MLLYVKNTTYNKCMDSLEGRILIGNAKPVYQVRLKHKVNQNIFVNSLLSSLIFVVFCLNVALVLQLLL